MSLANYNRRSSGIDWILLLSYLSLVVIGLLMVYTTNYNEDLGSAMWSLRSPFGAQILMAGVSLVFLIVLSFIDWHFWNSASLPIYILSILSLLFVILFGNEIKGAKSWISIGPWTIQPSEFAKLAVIIFCASLLSSIQIKLNEFKSQVVMLAIISLPALLIILQPDPGSAITYFSLLVVFFRFGMPTIYYLIGFATFLTVVSSLIFGFYLTATIICLLFLFTTVKFSRKEVIPILIFCTILLSSILLIQFGQDLYAFLGSLSVLLISFFVIKERRTSRIRSIVGILSLVLISFGSSFAFNDVLKPHQQDRINVWLQPEKCDPQGSLYNLLQSKLAIGSGGLSGKGYLKGPLTRLNYVPEQTTDFIFSSIGEEQGFIGGVSVILLFTILTLRLIKIGESSKYQYIRAYCYGVAGLIFLHFFINIGMTMGASPVIGIPLPFISKGGSALIAFSMMIGIALNMSKEK